MPQAEFKHAIFHCKYCKKESSAERFVKLMIDAGTVVGGLFTGNNPFNRPTLVIKDVDDKAQYYESNPVEYQCQECGAFYDEKTLIENIKWR